MTVIAYKDGVLATDSSAWFDNLALGSMKKLHRLATGKLLACSGSHALSIAVQEWADSGWSTDGKPVPVEDNRFAALWLREDGVWHISSQFLKYRDPGPFAAQGCHREFMLGAMMHGASAIEAVELAIKYGDSARGPVQWGRYERQAPSS